MNDLIEDTLLAAGYYFGLHETTVIDQTGKNAYPLRRIVIKNRFGFIAENGFTGLEAYIRPYVGPYTYHGDSPTCQKMLMVCQALNYFTVRGVRRLYDINTILAFEYFEFYRRKPVKQKDEHHVNQPTLNRCVKTVSEFLANLGEDGLVNIAPDDIMRPEYVRTQKSRRERKIYVPLYHKKALYSAPSKLMRQMPAKALDMLIDMSKAYDPMITFAIILQAKAGLREGEAMNVRQEDSPLSATPGISISMFGSQIKSIEIDLTREYLLRSDGMDIGKIKRDTLHTTTVYPKNNAVVYTAYKEHLTLLQNVQVEENYKPMFVDRNGYAMTARTYCERFRKILMKHLLPQLLESNDPELSAFGQLLLTHTMPPHVLRHNFTVELVCDGLSVAEVQHYRGDRSAESAMAYLKNKGILVEQLEKYHTIVIEGLTDFAPNYFI